jgi:putative transposase
MLRKGQLTQADIARHLGVSQVAVAKWKQQLEAGGGKLAALRSTCSGHRQPPQTARQSNAHKRVILKGAIAAGFTSERWTLPRIQTVVRARWGVVYSTAWLSIRLRALGLSVQRPTTLARAKDDALAEAWLEQDWPRIKKSAVEWRTHRFR